MHTLESYLTPTVQGDHVLGHMVTGACHYFTSTTGFQKKIRIGSTTCGRQYRAQADTSPQRTLLNSIRPLKPSLSVKKSLDCKVISTFSKPRVKSTSNSQWMSLRRPYRANCECLWPSWRQEAHPILGGICLSL